MNLKSVFVHQSGMTALMALYSYKNRVSIEFMVQKGADVSIGDEVMQQHVVFDTALLIFAHRAVSQFFIWHAGIIGLQIFKSFCN